MSRHDLLAALHANLAPRTYLEIGVRDGRSLTLSRATTIGVDPAFEVTSPVACDLRLVKATSDEFFAAADAREHFAGLPVDLAFIDGLHHAEFAYRDFFNTEAWCGPASVIVLDDVMPRTADEASRAGGDGVQAGDVFKAVEIIRERRPDLTVIPVNTRRTGMLVVLGVDPTSTVLRDRYDEVVARLESDDPQSVPDHVLRRTGAVDAAALAASPIWARLLELRDRGADRADVAAAIAEIGGPVTPRS
ncbi:MAG: class I SAM-dependent methyltransferase [Acidimicrobiia bacterium]|nr:class I SAM-dependent methyltransferase [Acidimicrobiia bacterium]